MKPFMLVVVKALAILGSFIVILLSVGTFMFTAATSPSDPNEQHLPFFTFALMMVVIGGVSSGWIFYGLRRRKWLMLIIGAPFNIMFLIGTVIVVSMISMS